MRALYEIDNDILSCVDEETGEVDEKRLNELTAERERKIEGVALWVKELTYDVEMYKAESNRIKTLRDRVEKTIESLKRWLVFATDGEKYHSEKVDVTFRKSKQLVISEDAFIPPTYTKIQKSVDKARLKKDILNGMTLAGVEIVENVNTQVK